MDTHKVFNQVWALTDYHLLKGNQGLRAAQGKV